MIGGMNRNVSYGRKRDPADGSPCVLVLRLTAEESSVRLMKGVKRYADKAGWSLRRLDYRTADGVLVQDGTNEPLDVRGLLKLWRPIGLIVDAGLLSVHVPDIFGRSRIPIVFSDCSPDEMRGRAPVSACVAGDADALAEAAFDELARQGVASFAYVPFTDPGWSWSRARGEAFERRVRVSGAAFSGFSAPESDERRTRALAAWLKGLPKPCGVFAANDAEAERVRNACLSAGVGIPDEVVLMGVDNRRDICESGDPTLTSVEQDFEACGYLSARQLDRLVSGERLPKGRAVAFGVSQVVRRASTRRLVVYDGRVARALEFIRLHATDRITPPDVVAVMGCRRSYADQRFRECTGHTILDEIRSRRVGRVKELVRRDACGSASLCSHSGFASMIDLRRVFKALTGQTLSQWRAAHAHGTAP